MKLTDEQLKRVHDFINKPLMKFDTREGLYDDLGESKQLIHLLLADRQAWKEEAEAASEEAIECRLEAIKNKKESIQLQKQLNQAVEGLTSLLNWSKSEIAITSGQRDNAESSYRRQLFIGAVMVHAKYKNHLQQLISSLSQETLVNEQ